MELLKFRLILQLSVVSVCFCSCIYSANGMASLSVCINGNRYQVNQESCPGGIVFKKQFKVDSSKNCLCIEGTFHMRDSEGAKIISGDSHCLDSKNFEHNPLLIHHLIPLSHPQDQFGLSTLSFWNHAYLEDNYIHRLRLPAKIQKHKIPKYMHFPSRKTDSFKPTETDFQEFCFQSDTNEIEFPHTVGFPEKLQNFSCLSNFEGSRTKFIRNVEKLNVSIDSCQSCKETKEHIIHKREIEVGKGIVTSGESPFGAGGNSGETWVEGLTDREEKSWEKFLIEDYQLVEYKLRLSAVQIYPLKPTTHKLKLLQMSKEVVKRAIGRKIIPNAILDEAFEFFNYLFYGSGQDTLSLEKFSDIEYALEQCLNGAHELKFHFTDDGTCPQKVKYFEYKPITPFGNASIENIDTDTLIGNDRMYSSKDHDPIVEIMWKVVDFAHSYCHEDFGFHLNMHHYYEQEMEKLFLLHPIQERWFRFINPETYQVLLPYSNLVNHIENMDRIVGSVHLGRHYNYWLRKPKSNHLRKRRDIEKENEPFADHEIWDGLAYCLKTTDAHGTALIPNLRELNTYLAAL